MGIQKTSIVIVGTGFGGLCMAAKLKMAGRDDFVILEKASEIGGTWRENRYPGAECDVASVLYSYSFYPNPTWDFKWAKQKQILEYLNRFTDDMGIRDHIRFGQTVSEATFDERAGRWDIKTVDGNHYNTAFFVPALGQLHYPQTPEFDGADENMSRKFHTAEWPDDMDLSGQTVAIIGNAASAIQLIPKAAEAAKHVVIYQRSANWVIPKGDRPYSRFEKSLAKYIPGLAKLYRGFWFCVGEFALYPMIMGRKLQSRIGVWACKREMGKFIKNKEMIESLTPKYPIGAKRVLLSDTYYPALVRENVTLVTEPIEAFTKTGIRQVSGDVTDFDMIIYATGFETVPFYNHIDVRGRNGICLREQWEKGAQAYRGVITADFPNMFMLYGPNTNTGHTSIVFKLENQVNYILQLIETNQESVVSVKPFAEEAFNADIQARLMKTAWAQVEASWYKNGDKIDRNWPGSGIEYKKMMKNVIWDDFDIRARESA